MKIIQVSRSAITGQFVTKKYACRHPRTTVMQTIYIHRYRRGRR